MEINKLFKSSPFRGLGGLLLLLLLPSLTFANDISSSLSGMQPVLDNVYNEMLPLCSQLIGAARGIAGFAALFYIASRVWRQIAAAEPLDFYPLLRPFALGLAIVAFPAVIALMNGLLQPVVSATAGMVTNSNAAIAKLLKQKEDAVKHSSAYQMYVGDDGNGDESRWYKYTHPDDPNGDNEGVFDGIGNSVKFWMDKNSYKFKNDVKKWMSEALEIVYAAAALCINTIRTFFLIVLAILGPLVFGLSVFDGLQHSLQQWIARYINIFLWLPIANIFSAILGKIQQNMLKIDLSQISAQGDTFFSPYDAAYLVFMCIGIVGYFTVPNVAGYIVNAGGGNAMLQKINALVVGGSSQAYQGAQTAGGMAADGLGNMARWLSNGQSVDDVQGDYFKDKLSGKEKKS